MEDFSKYLDIHRTFSLMCCMFWILSPAAGNIISKVVGGSATLQCNDESINLVTQLTWKRSRISLFTFIPPEHLHIHPEALSLNINMSKSMSQQYALVIDAVQTSHTGNYTCETNTATGVWEQAWELIITESEEYESWETVVIVVVATVLVCVLIITLILLPRKCKRCAENLIHSPTAVTQEQTEDIYENCLETGYVTSNRRGCNHLYTSRTH